MGNILQNKRASYRQNSMSKKINVEGALKFEGTKLLIDSLYLDWFRGRTWI